MVAANNHYDAEYIRYFTGISAEVVPSYCGYAAASAGPYAPQVLAMPQRTSARRDVAPILRLSETLRSAAACTAPPVFAPCV